MNLSEIRTWEPGVPLTATFCKVSFIIKIQCFGVLMQRVDDRAYVVPKVSQLQQLFSGAL